MKIAIFFLVSSFAFRHFERQIRSGEQHFDSEDEQNHGFLRLSDQFNMQIETKSAKTSSDFFFKGNAYNQYQRLNHLMESFHIPGQRTKFYWKNIFQNIQIEVGKRQAIVIGGKLSTWWPIELVITDVVTEFRSCWHIWRDPPLKSSPFLLKSQIFFTGNEEFLILFMLQLVTYKGQKRWYKIQFGNFQQHQKCHQILEPFRKAFTLFCLQHPPMFM